MTNIFDVVFQIIDVLGGFAQSLWAFLFYTVSIPFIGDFSVIGLLGGAGLIAWILYGIIRG